MQRHSGDDDESLRGPILQQSTEVSAAGTVAEKKVGAESHRSAVLAQKTLTYIFVGSSVVILAIGAVAYLESPLDGARFFAHWLFVAGVLIFSAGAAGYVSNMECTKAYRQCATMAHATILFLVMVFLLALSISGSALLTLSARVAAGDSEAFHTSAYSNCRSPAHLSKSLTSTAHSFACLTFDNPSPARYSHQLYIQRLLFSNASAPAAGCLQSNRCDGSSCWTCI